MNKGLKTEQNSPNETTFRRRNKICFLYNYQIITIAIVVLTFFLPCQFVNGRQKNAMKTKSLTASLSKGITWPQGQVSSFENYGAGKNGTVRISDIKTYGKRATE